MPPHLMASLHYLAKYQFTKKSHRLKAQQWQTRRAHINENVTAKDEPIRPATNLLFKHNQKYGAEPNLRPPGVCASKPWSISSVCKNLRDQQPLRAEMQSLDKFNSGGSTFAPTTFLFVDQSSPTFFLSTGEGLQLINYFFDFRHVDPFRRHSRSKSIVVRNSAEFQTFFCPPKFQGGAFPKSCLLEHPCLAARRVEKFRDVTPTSAKVIGANTVNFKHNFT